MSLFPLGRQLCFSSLVSGKVDLSGSQTTAFACGPNQVQLMSSALIHSKSFPPMHASMWGLGERWEGYEREQADEKGELLVTCMFIF